VNSVITLKRYSHLLDARVTEAAQHFDRLAFLSIPGPRFVGLRLGSFRVMIGA
jgi:hypothetical protein